MSDDEFEIPLSKAIEALRRELLAAVREGEDQEVRFALGPIELEFQVEVSWEAGADAGIRFWVVSLSGKGSRTSGTSHTVRLSLNPVLASEAPDSETLLVGSDQVTRPR